MTANTCVHINTLAEPTPGKKSMSLEDSYMSILIGYIYIYYSILLSYFIYLPISRIIFFGLFTDF